MKLTYQETFLLCFLLFSASIRLLLHFAFQIFFLLPRIPFFCTHPKAFYGNVTFFVLGKLIFFFASVNMFTLSSMFAFLFLFLFYLGEKRRRRSDEEKKGLFFLSFKFIVFYMSYLNIS